MANLTDRVVVDASLALKWVLDEPGSNEALALLEEWRRSSVLATGPSWLACEVGNVLYQEVRRGTFTVEEAGELLDAALAQIHLEPESAGDARRALRIAQNVGHKSVYDSQYAALAERLGCELWTADDRFVDAVRGILPRVRSLSEWQPSTGG